MSIDNTKNTVVGMPSAVKSSAKSRAQALRREAYKRSKERKKDSARRSAPILVALYGDCPWNGCFSSIGTYCAVP